MIRLARLDERWRSASCGCIPRSDKRTSQALRNTDGSRAMRSLPHPASRSRRAGLQARHVPNRHSAVSAGGCRGAENNPGNRISLRAAAP
ncbi:hypothetical protein ACFOEY_12050 [Paracandidimonas soli]|uniref:hypothetical protein n=1 Tax=Paracandidimonas soli TaxID=1917182 RepID=UPI003608AB47